MTIFNNIGNVSVASSASTVHTRSVNWAACVQTPARSPKKKAGEEHFLLITCRSLKVVKVLTNFKSKSNQINQFLLRMFHVNAFSQMPYIYQLEFGDVGLRRGKNRSTRRKTSRSKDQNQQQTQPTYDAESGNRTRATLVGSECSHHCAILNRLQSSELLTKRTTNLMCKILLSSCLTLYEHQQAKSTFHS